MSKDYENKNTSDGGNRCRRCDRPLSNPSDTYGWRCAEIVGLGEEADANILDDGELLLYNDYINLHSLHTKSEPRGSFTTKGKNYKNTFVKEETEKPEEIKYNVITDVTVLGEKFQVEYTIDNGVVRFPFEDNDAYWSILWHGGGKTLAKAIYDASRELSSDNFSGRTIDGVNAELQLHFAAYKGGIMKKNAKTADIGGMNKPGYDSNAWLFESIQLTEDIVNPKATDVVDVIKEIWRYYKR